MPDWNRATSDTKTKTEMARLMMLTGWYWAPFLPDLTYGFNFAVSYKNLDLSASFQGQRGHSILNRKRGEIIFTTDTNIDAELANNLWTGEGTSNRYPSAAGLRKGWNQNMSDYFVEDWRLFQDSKCAGLL